MSEKDWKDEWKKVGGKSNFLKFEVGGVFTGVYKGHEERKNPFYDATKEGSLEMITDYKIDINDEEKILSSTSGYLNDNLKPLEADTKIRIEMVQKGIKKIYILYTQE